MASKNKDEWILLSNDNLFSSYLSHVGLKNLEGVDYYYESTKVRRWKTASVDKSDKEKFDKKMIKIVFTVMDRRLREIWIDLNKIEEYSKILMPPFYSNNYFNWWTYSTEHVFVRPTITFANNLVRDDICRGHPVFFKLNNKWQVGHVMSYHNQLKTFIIQKYNELDINKYYKDYINNLIMKPTMIIMPIEDDKYTGEVTFDFEWYDDKKCKNYYNKMALNDCNSIYPCSDDDMQTKMLSKLSKEETDYIKNLTKLTEHERKNRKTVNGKYFDNIIGLFKNSLYCDHFFMSKNVLEYLVYGVYNNYYKHEESKTHVHLPIDLCNMIIKYFGINDSYNINYHYSLHDYEKLESPARYIRLLLFNTLNNIISNKDNVIRIQILRNDLYYRDKAEFERSGILPSKIEFGIIGIKNNNNNNSEKDALFNFIYNQNTHKTYLDIPSLVKHLIKLNIVFKIYMITFDTSGVWSRSQSCEYNYIDSSTCTIDKDGQDGQDRNNIKGMITKPMKWFSDDSNKIFYNWTDIVGIVLNKQYKQDQTVSSFLTFFKNDRNLFKHDLNNTFKDGFVQIDSNLRFYPFVTVNRDCSMRVHAV